MSAADRDAAKKAIDNMLYTVGASLRWDRLQIGVGVVLSVDSACTGGDRHKCVCCAALPTTTTVACRL